LKRRVIFAIGLFVLIADQLSKFWVRHAIPLETAHPILPGFLDLTYVRNTGAAFSIFQNGAAGLAVLSALAVLGISVFVMRTRVPVPALLALGVALPLGGSAGNLVDRAKFGWVTDFILVHWREHQFPVFNVADSSICVGVAILMYHYWRTPSAPAPAATETAETAETLTSN